MALDESARGEVVQLAGQLAQLALESYHGRKLAKAEEAALLAAVRKVQAERVFTPTDEILGKDEARAVKNPEAAGTPDSSS